MRLSTKRPKTHKTAKQKKEKLSEETSNNWLLELIKALERALKKP
ncbi:hypothetical protein ES703_18076 [subsurface metagenome]